MVLNRVALTGASGVLGRHLLAALADAGIAVSATSRSEPENLPADACWTPWDLAEWRESAALDTLFAGAGALIHAGAAMPQTAGPPDSRMLLDANLRGTLCLGQWAFGHAIPVIYVSGAIVYAEPDRTGIVETDPTAPGGLGGFYGTTKLLGEQVLAGLDGADNLLTVLRPSSIYGAGLASNKMIRLFFDTAAAGDVIRLTPPVDDRIDLVHAADVAAAAVDALTGDTPGVFNIGGALVSIADIAAACIDAAGAGGIEIADIPLPRQPSVRYGLDCGAAQKAFGYAPSIGLQTGIRMMSTGLCRRVAGALL